MTLYDKITHAIGTAAMTVLIASEGGVLPMPAWLRIVLLLAMGFAGISTNSALGTFTGRAAAAGIVFGLLALGSAQGCATGQAKAVGAAELQCAKEAAPDVIAAVLRAVSNGAASDPAKFVPALDGLAEADGLNDLKCVVLGLLAKPPQDGAEAHTVGAQTTGAPSLAQRQALAVWVAAR